MVAISVLMVSMSAATTQPSTTYMYPFYVPSRGAWLFIVGIEDGTQYRIYNVSYGGLEKNVFIEDAVKAMEAKWYWLKGDAHYLMESSKKVSAGIITSSRKAEDTALYVTSVEGGYVGTDFVFLCTKTNYAIIALEDSKVAIYDSKGSKVREFEIEQNHTKELIGAPSAVYRIKSTGRIAVISLASEDTIYPVSHTGALIGRDFITRYSTTSAAAWILVMPYEPCKVEVYTGGTKIGEHMFTEAEVKAGKYWTVISGRGGEYRIKSTGDVTVMVAAPGQFEKSELNNTRGLFIFGIPAGREVKVYSCVKTIIYAIYDCNVEVDDSMYSLNRGGYLELMGAAVRTIKSDKPVIVEVVNQIKWRTGSYLISDVEAEKTYPPVKPGKKAGSEGLMGVPIPLLVIVAIVTAITAAILLKRKR